MEMTGIEESLPKNHLLRKIDPIVNITHIYDLMKEL